MPKRGRTSQALSGANDDTIIFYGDTSAGKNAAPSSPTVGVHWYDEPTQAISPPTRRRKFGKRLKMAPKTTSFDIGPFISAPTANASSWTVPNTPLGDAGPAPSNFTAASEGDWEDVDEPSVLPQDPFTIDSNDAGPKKEVERLIDWGRIQTIDSNDAGPKKEWTGVIWQPASLADLGIVLYLGHGGKPCPDIAETSTIHVGDLSGFIDIKVQYCKHDLDASITKAQQLLRARLFPCSDLRPKSAFTIGLLDTFNVFTTLGRTSAYKFYLVLARITKPGFPTKVKDRYRELMHTYRRFLHVLNLRRAGHLFHHHPQELHPGDQALDCFPCPRPGFNFEWEEVLPEESPWFRSKVSWDGNFCNVRKAKKVDSGDISLSDGHGYSPPKGPYKEWTKLNHGPQREARETDNMSNIAEQWNFEIMSRLPKTLPERYKKARPEYLKQKAVHDQLTLEVPQEKIAAWESESLEPVKDSTGKWVSPLMDPIFINGNFHSVVRTERDQETPTARTISKRPGVTRWISAGIELEHSMKKILDKGKELGSNPTMGKADNLNTQRLAISDRVVAHERKRLTYMGEIDTPDHPEFSPIVDDAMDGAIVLMPSSYSSEIIQSAGLPALAELEGQLRRAMCSDTLESIRQLLGAKAFSLKHKKQHARGQAAMTRARAAIDSQTAQLERARWRYNNSRSALLRLGLLTADDKENYLELSDKDLQTLKSYIEETSRGLGQGHAAISWIWRTSIVKNKDEWELSILRTEWFRSRERYKRWKEQLILLKREMVMAIRSFLKHREIWMWKGVQPNTMPGMQAYALARAEWFKDLATFMYSSCCKSLEDETVQLEWSTEWLRKNVAGMFHQTIILLG
ncbi:hypothetical protein RSAG8_08412, partial [Rhizoctonia solani AG-8 WAC10335]